LIILYTQNMFSFFS